VDKHGRPVDQKTLEAMTVQMAHRGPDDAGLFLDGCVGLGHRRLSIIDLQTGHQPMFNEDRTVVVIFNGEIYNFAQVKANLEKKGHVFATHSDTEVIVHAYEEKGSECVNLFRGMFAFILYDSKKGKLLLARDRVGIKPLYYYMSRDALVFASEIKAILKSGYYTAAPSASAIDFYMTLGYVPGANTAFEGIMKLLPGNLAIYENGNFQTRRYWDIEVYGGSAISFREAQIEFHELFKETVELHLMSDVSLGVFLSGGLDSSSVVAYMKKHLNRDVKTFSVGYGDDSTSSELGFARIVADHFETQHFEHVLTAEDFFNSIDLFLDHVEEPIVESAGIALFRLAQRARSEGVIVLLSGEGADEILAGYPLYKIMSKVDSIKAFTDCLPRRLVHMLLGIRFKGEKRLKYEDWLAESLEERYRTISCDVTSSIKQQMYRPEYLDMVRDGVSNVFEGLLRAIEKGSILQKMLYVDMKTWLPDDLLLKADKMTMAASTELRVPFLDHKMIEFASSLPDKYKLRRNCGKYLLREITAGILPQQIIHRKKMGFPVPIAKWFGGPIYNKCREILLDKRTQSRGYFNDNYLSGILDRHAGGGEDLSRRIFSLLTLELWHRKYIDG
jgi:asparagine synthase (glutamine-hydrolysing)